MRELCEQDKEWILGMVGCDDYARDIIDYIEKGEMVYKDEEEL